MFKKVFKSGFKKNDFETKTRFDLIPFELLEDIAKHFTYGAKKYGEGNWKLATENEIHILQEAGFRHAIKWAHNINDEEHGISTITNIIMFEWHKKYKK